MAELDNEIRISITLDDGSVREGFARIKKEGSESGHDLKEAFADVKKELLGVLAAYVGFEAAKEFVTEAISVAMQYETALNNMNKSLQLAGTYKAEASAEFRELAKSIAETSTVTETQALALEATARNYSRNNEQARALTKAAVDLAAATGKDAASAVAQLGATLEGTSGRLAKMVPELKSMTEMQLRSGDAIQVVAQRFKDAASGELGTFDGTIKKLKNAFEELQVAIGSIITESPTIRAVLQFITSQLDALTQAIKGVGGRENFIKQFTLDAIAFGEAFNKLVILPIEMLGNVVQIAIAEIKDFFQDFIATFADAAARIVGFFSPNSALATGLKTFAESSREVLAQFDQDVKTTLKNIGDSKFSDGFNDQLQQLKDAVDNAQPMQALNDQIDGVKENIFGLSGEITNLGQSFKLFGQGASDGMLKLRNDAVKYMREAGEAVTKTFAGGIANGMAAIGKALVKGENIFKAFAGAILSALGQAAIQMGAVYLLMGIARVATSYGADATGWELIGVGAGLSVLGGALMALGDATSSSGSGAPSASSAGGGAGGGGGTGAPVASDPAAQAQQQKSQVTVNIQGSVFDTQETGLRIVELVNGAFNTQGAVVQVK